MIYLAKISVEIKRAIRKQNGIFKYEKIKKTIDCIYTEGTEKKKDSYLMQCLNKELKIRDDKNEDFKITNIEKIKTLGLNE